LWALLFPKKKRHAEQIDGNTNWHYNSPLFYRASEIDYGEYGVIAEADTFDYEYYGDENTTFAITSMNLTVQIINQPNPVFTHYQYFYNNNTLISHICVNSCAKNQTEYYYDALSRIIGVKETGGNLSFVHYNAAGQAEVVAHNGKTWDLSY